MSIKVGVVDAVGVQRDGWTVTVGGWSVFLPSTPNRQPWPKVGDQAVVVTMLPNGEGAIVGLVIGGRVYLDENVPFVSKCVPGATPTTAAPERVSDGAMLDAVRVAVLELLLDAERRSQFDPYRWRELRSAVLQPVERDPSAPSSGE